MSTAATFVACRPDNLGLAVIAASRVPLLLLDNRLVVMMASRSFAAIFGGDPSQMTGRPLATLGSGEWGGERLQQQLADVIATGEPVADHEFDLRPKGRPNRRLSLDAEAVDDAMDGERFLLLSLTDLTPIRAQMKAEQDRIDERDVLFRELQHRIANSLQIISSVLMQSARRTGSEETRGQLEAAHHRILSVAAVQNHLAATRTGDVRLRPYLTTLCRGIAASMIHDPARVALEVMVDDSVADADDAMSLGLIATELVINALKYAFPDRRPGRITLSYESGGGGWTLLVADDGVGMRTDTPMVPAGLGTTIVDALARKLKAKVLIGFGAPGMRVSING